MKKLIYFLLATVFIFVACNKEDVGEKPVLNKRTIELKGTMPEITATGGATARMLLNHTDGGQEQTNTIFFKWEVGDKVQLAYVQGTNTWSGSAYVGVVHTVEDDGKTCYFNLPLPDGLDVNAEYMIYGAAGGTKDGAATFIGGTTNISISNVGQQHFGLSINGVENTAQKNAVLTFQKQMPEGMFTRVEFKHIGTFLALRIYNNSTLGATLNFTGANLVSKANPQVPWYYGGSVVYNVATGEASQTPMTTAKFLPLNTLTLTPGMQTGLIWQWIIPYKVAVGNLELLVEGNTETVDVMKIPQQLMPGKWYRITRGWSGTTFGDVGGFKFTTDREPKGSGIRAKIIYGDGGAWADLNTNGVFDAGDQLVTNGGDIGNLYNSYRPYDYYVYGEILAIDLVGNDNEIVSAITNSKTIKVIELSGNNINKAPDFVNALRDMLLSLPDWSGLTTYPGGGYINLYQNVPTINIDAPMTYIDANGTPVTTTYRAYACSKGWNILFEKSNIYHLYETNKPIPTMNCN